MATYDLTSSDTAFVNADSIAAYPSGFHSEPMRVVSAYFDLAALIENGYTLATGDIFNLLEIPASTLVVVAGAEVVSAFDGTATVDIDFAGGDDIVDGADVTSTGACAAGTNGTATTVIASATKSYTDLITTTDTIDVLLTSANATEGVLRVWAAILDLSDRRAQRANEVTRDQLA